MSDTAIDPELPAPLGHASPSIAKIGAALAKAQAEMEGASKDSMNPHFKSKYADLASIWDACRGPLSKHEIAVVQLPRAYGQEVTVTTMLIHSSGEWIAEGLTLSAAQATPQAVGSAITYGRRYGLAAMVGIAPEDDDGEAAEGRSPNGYSVKAPREVSAPPPAVTRGNSSAPNEAENSGALTIKEVHREQTRNPNVTKFQIVLSDGRMLSTIKNQLGDLAEQLCQEGVAVDVDTKSSRFGEDVVAIHRQRSEARQVLEALTAEDIPF